jgi:hypothetical protein
MAPFFLVAMRVFTALAWVYDEKISSIAAHYSVTVVAVPT